MNPRTIPVEVAGERRRFAEHQPAYLPIEAAVQHNAAYCCTELVTAWMPTDEELERFASVVDHELEMRHHVDHTHAVTEALRIAFARWPVLFSHLTSGPLVPHNLHLGSSAELEDPARAL